MHFKGNCIIIAYICLIMTFLTVQWFRTSSTYFHSNENSFELYYKDICKKLKHELFQVVKNSYSVIKSEI